MTLDIKNWRAEFDDKFILGTRPPNIKLTTHDGLEVKAWIDQLLTAKEEEVKQKRYLVEGISIIIKFIRNKARQDILKADMYGQGYYQCIKDLEDYCGISYKYEMDALAKANVDLKLDLFEKRILALLNSELSKKDEEWREQVNKLRNSFEYSNGCNSCSKNLSIMWPEYDPNTETSEQVFFDALLSQGKE